MCKPAENNYRTVGAGRKEDADVTDHCQSGFRQTTASQPCLNGGQVPDEDGIETSKQ